MKNITYPEHGSIAGNSSGRFAGHPDPELAAHLQKQQKITSVKISNNPSGTSINRLVFDYMN